jgi:hypothetical protein
MVLVLVSWSRGRWRGGTTTGVGPSLACFGCSLVDFGIVGSLLGLIAFLGSGLSDRFRLGQVDQPLVAKGDCIGDDQSFGSLRLLGLLGESEQRVDLHAQLAVEVEQTLVTDRTALGGIGVDFGAVQTEVAQGQHPKFLGV